MARPDPYIAAHLEWIGFVRPTGLVVSAPALVKAGAILNRRDAEGQELLRECAMNGDGDGQEYSSAPWLPDFQGFAATVLGWSFSPGGYAGTNEAPIPPELEVVLPDSGGVLRPDFAVRRERLTAGRRDNALEIRDGANDQASAWQLLVCCRELGEDFDKVSGPANGAAEMSPHGTMERLLRQTGVPAGLLFNGVVLRLVSAPKGENSGWLDFRVADMLQTAGRPISTAMRELLGQHRLLLGPRESRLAALLEDSRKYQNEVSERLSEQVLHALYELLRGFQAAHDASKGTLLEQPLDDAPDEVCRSLLTVVLRLVFLLYAEERDMLPQDETFVRSYSLASLYERLREDAALNPDTMDQRYGAYAQLLVLTRMVHDGARSGRMSLPPRHGALFDPDRYRFLEGRGAQVGGARQVSERIEPPLVPDGIVYRVLEKLIVLDGERISYRALDVEHVGSVYETMMGFRLETATGRSVAIKAAKKHGAPATVDVEALLQEAPNKRAKWLQDRTDRKLTDRVRRMVQEAVAMEGVLAALDSVIDKDATPDAVPVNAMVLQPSEERRRSGSHYTPRELTEPIVRETLAPIVGRLRDDRQTPPKPEQILDLKVCDPAMGSGAFLVEACRQLGDALVEAWHAHDALPDVPPDENETVFARRQVAQRCLYGVDRNPAAVDLAKLSLWLVTLAKDHPLTFLDHALRQGDSLVGLNRIQIDGFHWKEHDVQEGMEAVKASEHLKSAANLRRRIREADDSVSGRELRDLWDASRYESGQVALLGDLVLAAFFEGSKPKEREKLRQHYAGDVLNEVVHRYRGWLEELRDDDPPLAPFHWQLEFPEVFDRGNPGFDVIVGNPPFAGKNTVIAANRPGYTDWLKQMHADSHGNADLVAHFFRRAFDLMRTDGAFGLISTNTIAQGDTRSTGLRWICENGGEIYRAKRRFKWPGLAAVVVSVLHVWKGRFAGAKHLDDDPVERITAFLFHRGGHTDPARLKANAGKSFQGSIVLGMGFTFDDTDKKGVATPIAEMERLIGEDPRNQEVISPYIGGEEVNKSPAHQHHRYAINFHDFPLQREPLDERWEHADLPARQQWMRQGIVPIDYPHSVATDWWDLLEIVRVRAKPHRDSQKRKALRDRWWQYAEKRPGLYSAIRGLSHVLVTNCGAAPHHAIARMPANMVFAHSLIVVPVHSDAAFCTLQSRPHEIWARFFGSSMKDDLRYTPSDCFETYPFPWGWDKHPGLEAVGKAYYDFRAELMVGNDEGLTKTYNRFHDPDERDPRIEQLRDLHTDMDRAVLNAYGWGDIPTDCGFFLDYEDDEEQSGNRRRKPYRYRWPDEVRDEVLVRLLELNAERAIEERTTSAVSAN